jgi:hypothetical protein
MTREIFETLIFYNILISRRIRDIMVSVLSIRPMVLRSKPGRGDGFLREIKIRSTPSFGGQVKPSTHVVRFYGM